MDGVVYHPYFYGISHSRNDLRMAISGLWKLDCRRLSSKTTLPKWETEWGIGTYSGFHQHRIRRTSLPGGFCKRLASG